MFKYITEEMEMPTEIIDADYNQCWQAVIQAMRKYDLEGQNQEGGIIKTRWIDNTNALNFSDSFGSSDAVKSAKYKLTINVVKSSRGSQEVSKVSILKRQLVEQDFLQGWKEIPSDGIVEKTLLYRIKRIVDIDKRLRAIEKVKEKEALKKL